MTSAVASRYARALTDIVLSPGAEARPPDVVVQLESIEALLGGSPELRNALETPAVRAAAKRAVMGRFATDLGLSRVMRNFLFVLIDHQRIGLLAEIREAFEVELDQRLGFVRADVASAQPLDAGRTAELEAELSRLTGKQVRARFHVDPSLIGGVVARIGSTVYDGSIRGQLENMRREFVHHAAAVS